VLHLSSNPFKNTRLRCIIRPLNSEGANRRCIAHDERRHRHKSKKENDQAHVFVHLQIQRMNKTRVKGDQRDRMQLLTTLAHLNGVLFHKVSRLRVAHDWHHHSNEPHQPGKHVVCTRIKKDSIWNFENYLPTVACITPTSGAKVSCRDLRWQNFPWPRREMLHV
jgi:hypothetical protein